MGLPPVPYIFPMTPHDFSKTMDVFLDFHRSYLFRIFIFDDIFSFAINIKKAAAITYLISQSIVPSFRTEEIQLGWQGSKIKIAGKSDFGDWKCTMRDDHLNIATTYFSDWKNNVFNYKTGQSKMYNYKKTAIVALLPSGNISDAIIGTKAYLLHGIWPKEVGEISLDYSQEGIITFPVTFACDYWEPYSITDSITGIIGNIL